MRIKVALVPARTCMANRLPVGAIVGGVGAAAVFLTLLTLSLHTWHRKRVRDAAAQHRVDQFKLSPPVPQQSHYYLSPSSSSSFPRSTSAPSLTDTKRGRFQHILPVIREMNGAPLSPINRAARNVAVPTPRNDEPPAYTAG